MAAPLGGVIAMANDFNDVVYWKTCVQHQLVFVTHDVDYHFMDVDIVSANRRLGAGTPSTNSGR